ncbi:MAG: DNA-processing protein DprA [Candidatus Jorgensenbacteria bacterium]|nr:DNA-processing protein DprA [Candidatus Jorgensenbacteria bacterium]
MELHIHTLSLHDAGYPARLREISDPPETLYVRGTMPPNEIPTVAIVGTRKATHEGREAARTLARALAGRGIVIISGLALGIDAAAHEGALDARGITVAVLGGGIDAIYPPSHESLGRRIEATGAIVSEHGAGVPSLPHQFLARNRLISGLSDAVVIVEAPKTSGALATARHAAIQGREVFVLPGPASHPHYAGSHMLLREGARLIRNADDLLEDLPALAEILAKQSPVLPVHEHPHMAAILATLTAAHEPLSVDKIAEQTTLEPNVVLQHLTTLALDGVVKEHNGKFIIQ